MQSTPLTMQAEPQYQDVVMEVIAFLTDRRNACLAAGFAERDVVLDPGIGFGKTLAHNLALLANLPRIIDQLESHVLVGISRKSMIDHLFSREVTERLPASLGLAVQSVLNGAKIVRVHDVRATHDAIRAVEAVININQNK
jgi:dihydropteroate synthase